MKRRRSPIDYVARENVLYPLLFMSHADYMAVVQEDAEVKQTSQK